MRKMRDRNHAQEDCNMFCIICNQISHLNQICDSSSIHEPQYSCSNCKGNYSPPNAKSGTEYQKQKKFNEIV